MPTYDIQGISVEFPYEAYECQLAYMEAVVRALENGENALLESPTGTGKTLCLLCATLSWRRHRQHQIVEARTNWEMQAEPGAPNLANGCPKIWYSSRTHSQLKQVVHELKGTSFHPATVVLGSRAHFCIHTSVSRHSGAKQNALCKRARDEKRCGFFTAHQKKQGSKVNISMMDVEEIVSACRTGHICPFYKSRDDAKEAELLFIPYDYLINPQTRESLQISLKNSILIFDEGHNIEKSCEEVSSFELKGSDIGNAITEIDDAYEILEQGIGCCEEALGDMTPEHLMIHLNMLKKSLLALESSILSERLERDQATGRMLLKRRGSYILELFGRGNGTSEGITAKVEKRIINVVRKAVAVLTFSMDTTASGGLYLDKLASLLGTMFRAESQYLDAHYQVLMYEDEDSKRGAKRKAVDFFSSSGVAGNKEAANRTLCLWCFSCSEAMRGLQEQGLRSVIITSGTLSPLDGTAESFGIPFPIVLQNSHVINTSKQVWGGVLATGPGNATLDASYAHRDDAAYLKDLGETVARFASCVPDGILLAFQSYMQKENVLRTWRQAGIFAEISKQKQVFEEPKAHAEMKSMMASYNDALARTSVANGSIGGGILAAVCRGKLCEGIDFTDRQCRMVFVLGIPYPARNDLRVLMKQNFMDTRGCAGDGARWYAREAIRAVNQTIGRVIRHRNDFGAVLLCDARYAKDGRLSSIASGISQWLRPRMYVPSSFEQALNDCQRFFSSVTGTPLVRPQPPSVTNNTGTQSASAQPSSEAHPHKEQLKSPSASTGPALTATPPSKGSGGAGISLATLRTLWKSRGSDRDQAQSPGEQLNKDVPQEHRAPTAPVAAQKIARHVPAKACTSPGTKKCAPPATTQVLMQPADILGSDQLVVKWLKAAEGLLPRMELEELKAQLRIMLKAADAASEANARNTNENEANLLAAMDEAARVLLPMFNFDTPEDQDRRHSLVKNGGQMLPKLWRPLWRARVESLFKSRGKECHLWAR